MEKWTALSKMVLENNLYLDVYFLYICLEISISHYFIHVLSFHPLPGDSLKLAAFTGQPEQNLS
jgi:hypothetical protein